MSDGVEWAVHCCSVLGALPDGVSVSSAHLAEFHGVPAAYLAKHLQALSAAGIVRSSPGRRGGYSLARPAAEVTMLDIVLAVEGDEPAFRCTEIRRRGPSGLDDSCYAEACGIAAVMNDAEQAWRGALAAVSLGDLVASLDESVHPEQMERAVNWLGAVVR